MLACVSFLEVVEIEFNRLGRLALAESVVVGPLFGRSINAPLLFLKTFLQFVCSPLLACHFFLALLE